MAYQKTSYVTNQLGTSPLNNMIKNAFGGYHEGVRAQYLPKQIQAEIFNKEIGPVAQLAASPNFAGFNPETQQMIGNYLHNYFRDRQGNIAEQQNLGHVYPSGQNIFERLEKGAKATQSPGARGKVSASTLGGAISKIFGENPFSNWLNKETDDAVAEQAKFENTIADFAQYLRNRNIPEERIRQLTKIGPGESPETLIEKWKPYLTGKINNESKVYNNEAEDSHVKATIEYFKDLKPTPDEIREAQKHGVKTAKEFREWIKWKRKGK